jgi:plastocyanin
MTQRLIYHSSVRTAFIIFYSFSIIPIGIAQKNTVSGKVVFPAIEKKIEIKRGSNYRNRLKSNVKDNSEHTEKTKALNSIISLHPIDMNISIQPKSVELRQKEKSFIPHVLAISVGSSVSFINEDEFYHNVFSLTKGSKFNIGRKKPGVAVTKIFDSPGLVEVFCDIHPHMNAKILCLDTPYYSSVNEDGSYVISQLPNGKYRVQFYNPDVEVAESIIDLNNGQVLNKDFILTSENMDTGSLIIPQRWLVNACCTGTVCSHSE